MRRDTRRALVLVTTGLVAAVAATATARPAEPRASVDALTLLQTGGQR